MKPAESPRLITPCADYRQSYYAYINELGNEERYPFPLDFDHSDFAAMLTRIENFRQGISLPTGYVPSTTLWLIQGHEMVGCTNIRHYLNTQIEHCGGHIGLSIRPKWRGQKLGDWLLSESIKHAKTLGNKAVHIHCHAHNNASKAMIESCGGKLHSTIEMDGELICRYQVTQ